MQSINLIPQQEIKEQTQEKAVKLSTVFSIVIVVISLGISGYLFFKTQGLKKQVTSLEDEISSSRKEIATMSEVEVSARNLDKKFLTIKDIFSNRSIYSKLSSELAARVPNGVIVDSLTIQKDAVINISGFADNYIAIASFTNNLLDTNYKNGDSSLKELFTQVTLNSVSLEKSRNQVSYSINVSVNSNLLKDK